MEEERKSSHVVKQGIPLCHWNRGVGFSKRNTNGLMGANFLCLLFSYLGASRNSNKMTWVVAANCPIFKHGKGPLANISL